MKEEVFLSAPNHFQFAYDNDQLIIKWDPQSYPEGFKVILEFVNEIGEKVTPQPEVEYEVGQAIVKILQIQEGDVYHVHAMVVSNWTETKKVVIHEIDPIKDIQVDWLQDALHVNWSQVSEEDSYEYEVCLLHADESPVDPQPTRTMEKRNQVSMDGSTLNDGETYIVAVRAHYEGSYGVWKHSQPYKINKKLPDSLLLRKLLDRVNRAIEIKGGQFNLDDDLVQEKQITYLFNSLLQEEGESIPLNNCDVSSTPHQVQIHANADYPFARNIETFFVFTDEEDKLVLNLTSKNIGSFSLQELGHYRLIPKSVYNIDDWGASLAPLPNLELALNSADTSLTIKGDSVLWEIPIGLVEVGIDPVTPELKIVESNAGKKYIAQLKTNLNLGKTTKIPIFLQLPSGLDGWKIGLDTPLDGLDIGDLSNFNPLMGGDYSLLPSEVIKIGHFFITELSMEFSPEPCDVWHIQVGFKIGQDEESSWKTAGELITVNQLTTILDMTIYKTDQGFSTSTIGSLRGIFELSDQLEVNIAIDLPGSNGLWRLAGGAKLKSFSLNALKSYIGGSEAPIEDTLNQLGTFGEMELSYIEILFDPKESKEPIKSLAVAFKLESWTVPSLSWLVMDNLELAVDIDRPLSSDKRKISGVISGAIKLGDFSVAAVVDFAQDESWNLKVLSQTGVTLGLDQMNEVVPSEQIVSFLPSTLPTNIPFGLGSLELLYDIKEKYLASVEFGLESNMKWDIFLDKLTLNKIFIYLAAEQNEKTKSWDLTGHLAGTFGVGNAVFSLGAHKLQPNENWTLYGEMEESTKVDFNEILDQLGSTLHIPSGYGFPTGVNILVAKITIVPSIKKVEFVGAGETDWSYDFANTSFAIKELGGELNIPGNDRKANGKINGDFTLGPLDGVAVIELSTELKDLKLDVVISKEDKADPKNVVDDIIAQDTFDSVPVPSTFVKPNKMYKMALSLDLDQNLFLLSGEYSAGTEGDKQSKYAGVALVIQKKSSEVQGKNEKEEKWGYILGAVLNNWRLSDISPILSGMDEFIGLKKASAGIVLSMLEEEAGEWMAKKVPILAGKTPIKPGLNFYVAMDFTQGILTQNIKSILEVEGEFKILGYIPKDTKKETKLSAHMGDIKLFSLFQFNKINLYYTITPSTEEGKENKTKHELKLNGYLIAKLDQDYTFYGDLLIDNDQAMFNVQTANRVENPLGIPVFSIEKLGLKVSCNFEKKEATKIKTAFYGEISFSEVVTLQGLIVLENASPTIIFIKLVNTEGEPVELSISSLFKKTIGIEWPDVLDIQLGHGQLWYVPREENVSFEDQVYVYGFHAHARTKIFFLPEIYLDVALYSEDTKKQKKGLVASAGFTEPIDWEFIKFKGTEKHGGKDAGPQVRIDTTDDSLPFGISSGIELFSEEIGDIDISVGREKMQGTLTLPDHLGPFSKAQFSFVWDEDGFHVKDWPLDNLDLPEFDLENIQGSGECSQIIVKSLPIDTEFDLDVNFSILPPSDKSPASLEIELNGTFNLIVTGEAYKNDPILTANIVKAKTSIPFPDKEGFHWDQLPEVFIKAIKSSAESIINNLLKDPVNMAKLAAVAGIKWGLPEVIDYLVCRGMSRQAAESAASAAAGAGVAEIAADACGAGAVAVGGVFATIVGGVVVVGSHHDDPKKPKPGKPGTPAMHFDTNKLYISWQATDKENTEEYAVWLRDSFGRVVPVSSVRGTQTEVPVSQLTLGHEYVVQIKAKGPGGVSEFSDKATLFLVKAPDKPELNFDGQYLLVTWNEVVGNEEYQVNVVDKSGQNVNLTSVEILETSARLQSARFENGGEFNVCVRATTDNVLGPWSSVSTLNIDVLTAPQNIVIEMSSIDIKVSWDKVEGATDYRGLVYDELGAVLSPQPEMKIQDTSAVIDGSEMKNGQIIQVSLKGVANNAVGIYCEPVSFRIETLPIPNNLELEYSVSEKSITASWDAVGEALSYQICVLNDKGSLIEPQPIINYNQTTAVFSTNAINEKSLSIQVKAVADKKESKWSQEEGIVLLDLVAPQGVTLQNIGSTICVKWSEVEGAERYGIQVLNEDETPLVPPPDVTYEETSAIIDASNLKNRTIYLIKVRAFAKQVVGPSSNFQSLEYINLLTPQNVKAIFMNEDDLIHMTWDEVAEAKYYRALVLDSNTQQALDPQPIITYKQCTAEINTEILGGMKDYLLSVRAELEDAVSFWSEYKEIKIIQVPIPEDLVLAYDKGDIAATWTSVKDANSYSFALKDKQGNVVTDVVEDIMTNHLIVKCDQLTSGEYYGQVRAVIESSIGNWSSLKQIVIEAPEEFAKRCKEKGLDAQQTGRALKENYPNIEPISFAKALACAGYVEGETTRALKQEYPTITVEQLVEAIKEAYGKTTPEEFAKRCKEKGLDAQQTGRALKENYPNIEPISFAKAFAYADYVESETSRALKQEYPDITIEQLVEAIKEAYGKTAPEEFAKQCKEKGWNALQAGKALKENYPNIEPGAFAKSLAYAEYGAVETSKALKQEYPHILAEELAVAIKEAFN